MYSLAEGMGMAVDLHPPACLDDLRCGGRMIVVPVAQNNAVNNVVLLAVMPYLL